MIKNIIVLFNQVITESKFTITCFELKSSYGARDLKHALTAKLLKAEEVIEVMHWYIKLTNI